MYEYLDSPVVLKISAILFDRLKNLRINENAKINLMLYVSSFPIPATCTSTCIEAAVALQLVKFQYFGKFKEDFSVLIRTVSVIC
jgi:hypothetical protein